MTLDDMIRALKDMKKRHPEYGDQPIKVVAYTTIGYRADTAVGVDCVCTGMNDLPNGPLIHTKERLGPVPT